MKSVPPAMVFILVAGTLDAGRASAQTQPIQWTQRLPTQRAKHAMAYDTTGVSRPKPAWSMCPMVTGR